MTSEDRHFCVTVDGDVVLGKQKIEFELEGEFIASMKSWEGYTVVNITLDPGQVELLKEALDDLENTNLNLDENGRIVETSNR